MYNSNSLSPFKRKRSIKSRHDSLGITSSGILIQNMSIDSNSIDSKKSRLSRSPKYLSHILQRQFQQKMVAQVKRHGEMLQKLEKQK